MVHALSLQVRLHLGCGQVLVVSDGGQALMLVSECCSDVVPTPRRTLRAPNAVGGYDQKLRHSFVGLESCSSLQPPWWRHQRSLRAVVWSLIR